jgi:molybdenum-dependent DNA-binding transcriptional regulator ModE
MGGEARLLAEQNYDFAMHVDRMQRLYESKLVETRKAGKNFEGTA